MNQFGKNRILPALLLIFACLSLARGGQAVPQAGFYLKPDRDIPWWYIGEDVIYRPSTTPPANIAAVEGAISDVSGHTIDTIRVDRANLLSSGWKWTPALPGYYEVAFRTLDQAGNSAPAGWTYLLRAPTGKTCNFTRDRQNFAVLPKPQVPEKGVGQFGFICDTPQPDDIPLARLVGLDTVRLLLPWGATFINANSGIGSVQGKENWGRTDPTVDALSQAGFTIYGQFLYTPTWASPHPEEINKIDICVRRANAYAPKDLSSFSRFVEEAVTRYGSHIHYWEIWNEPSMPGGSCFWADTPENYVSLLRAGSQAVKKIQPDGHVAIGGIGSNASYLAFYDRVLQLGGGSYFDVLSMHGSAYTTPQDGFRQIEKARGVAPKTAFQTEWHAILQGNMQSTPILSEQELSFQLLKSVLLQLKGGVQKTILFEMKNLSEKETINFAIANQWFTHSSGIFRRYPCLEPRHAAVIFANFLDLCGHRASYVRELKLGDDPGLVAVELATAHGPLVVFWSETRPLPLSMLAPLAGSGSSWRDWEGKTLTQSATLEPDHLAYLIGADEHLLAQTATTNRLVSPDAPRHGVMASIRAHFISDPLFSSVSAPATVPVDGWIEHDWKQVSLGSSSPGTKKVPGFSARAAVAVQPDGLDVVVEVHDTVHFPSGSPAEAWKGDSLQVAIDSGGHGRRGDNTELLFALGPNGPTAWKISAADPHSDIPSRWSPGNGPAQFVQSAIVRQQETTRYQIRIPWSELFPLTFDPAHPLRVALAVNDNDGSGRVAALEWGGGIVEGKDPSLYGELTRPTSP